MKKKNHFDEYQILGKGIKHTKVAQEEKEKKQQSKIKKKANNARLRMYLEGKKEQNQYTIFPIFFVLF